ncbi:unnamed protein product [Nezara viridula]|uniref:Uncharacterized protein n=1 Tax=Nezara viridula TaxID=85310 RepID=A0A9P0HAL6_NEZVI|nr:unnamed protein product [Nezara viridula]
MVAILELLVRPENQSWFKWSKVALVYERNGLTNVSGKFTSKLMMETLVEFLKIKGINYRAYDLEKNNLSFAENLKREIGNEYASKWQKEQITQS